MELTHLSLFSGIGGLDLAAEWAGFETVGQCEWADYPTKVLEKHWPDMPRWRDIRTLTGDSFYERTGLRTVDIISGGFPCQPFSVAGKQKGRDDDRYLWPEMLRVISELRPTWIVAENVENAVRLVLDDIIDGLEGIGYTAQAFVVSAYCSRAWFDGKRIFIVATPNDGSTTLRRNIQLPTDGAVARRDGDHGRRKKSAYIRLCPTSQPRPYGVLDGVPHRVDRLKCLGNAVVPQQAYPIFKAIAELENMNHEERKEKNGQIYTSR